MVQTVEVTVGGRAAKSNEGTGQVYRVCPSGHSRAGPRPSNQTYWSEGRLCDSDQPSGAAHLIIPGMQQAACRHVPEEDSVVMHKADCKASATGPPRPRTGRDRDGATRQRWHPFPGRRCGYPYPPDRDTGRLEGCQSAARGIELSTLRLAGAENPAEPPGRQVVKCDRPLPSSTASCRPSGRTLR